MEKGWPVEGHPFWNYIKSVKECVYDLKYYGVPGDISEYNFGNISHFNLITFINPTIPYVRQVSHGAHLLHPLAAHAACLAGGQVAIVAVLQVDTDLRGG